MSTWNKFSDPTPYPVVAGFAIDGGGNFPILHRSSKVRSAPNCWSLPSGLHEVGETQSESFSREMMEELQLRVRENAIAVLPPYENMPGDGWHWVITHLISKSVDSLDHVVNLEPDKHDDMSIASHRLLRNPVDFLNRYSVHPSAVSWYLVYGSFVYRMIQRALDWKDEDKRSFSNYLGRVA